MDPTSAGVVFTVGIIGLFVLNRQSTTKISGALWVPIVWFAIAASRPVSEWFVCFGLLDVPAQTADLYLQGSPLDRNVFAALMVLGLITLARRGAKVGRLLGANGPLLLFFLYCAASLVWSDYPDVAFKRWIKFLGDFIMVLVVLTDEDAVAATRRVLTRVSFLLVPLSLLFVKYYPDLGRGYNHWTWTPYLKGVATGKNTLGIVCLICGLTSLWCFLQAVWGNRDAVRRGPLIAHGAVLTMAIWLLWMADSMTSLSCFLIGSLILTTVSFRAVSHRRWLIHLLVVFVLSAAVFALFFDPGGGVLESLGRDPTLTGRTEIWSRVIGMVTNPFLGTGYESFWLGPRLQKMWSLYYFKPNQAHNGYIEVYLNLGWVGLALLAIVILTGYHRIVQTICLNGKGAAFWLALFVVALIYNCTEAAFKPTMFVWISFLLAVVAASVETSSPADNTPRTVPRDPFTAAFVQRLEAD